MVMLLPRAAIAQRCTLGAMHRCLTRVRTRALSTSDGIKRVDVGQRGTLLVRLRRQGHMEVASAWVDHLDVDVASLGGAKLKVDQEQQCVSIVDEEDEEADQEGQQPPGHGGDGAARVLRVVVPEKFNLDMELVDGDIRLLGKVEGDARAITSEGDIRVGKLRGPKLQLEAKCGHVEVDKYLEGDVSICATTIHAKMIKGQTVRVDVQATRGDHDVPSTRGREDSSGGGGGGGGPPVDIEALFSNSASVACTAYPPGESERTAVRIARSHGALTVMVQGGGVILGGVNGSAHVLGGAGLVDVQVEALEKGQSSVITTGTGCIQVQVAPDVKAKVDIKALGASEIRCGLTNLVRKEEGHRYINGVLTGLVAEPSRATAAGGYGRRVGSASGKIDLHGAQKQALKAFFSEGKGKKEEDEDLPIMRVQSQDGIITLRTVSWMDAIKRQFGLEHVDYHVPVLHGGGGSKRNK